MNGRQKIIAHSARKLIAISGFQNDGATVQCSSALSIPQIQLEILCY